MKNIIKLIEYVLLAVILFALFVILVTIYNYPSDFICYESYCKVSNLDKFESCVNIGHESCGFLCSNEYYLCNGIKVVKECLEYDIKDNGLNATIIDVLLHRCSKVGEKNG
jgi:hypothetical protein